MGFAKRIMFRGGCQSTEQPAEPPLQNWDLRMLNCYQHLGSLEKKFEEREFLVSLGVLLLRVKNTKPNTFTKKINLLSI